MTRMGELEANGVTDGIQSGFDRGVLRFITAGSVDDGKSTLIGRLLHDSKLIFEDQLSALAKDFNLQAQPDAQGLQWVSASPKSTDHSLQSIRMGLKQQGDQVWLAQLDILDAFGTRSQIVFDRIDINPRQVTLAQFSFTPPKGVEVIKP